MRLQHPPLTEEAGTLATQVISQVCQQFGPADRSRLMIIMASVIQHAALDLANTDGHDPIKVLNKGLDDGLAWYQEGVEAFKAYREKRN